MFSKVRTKEISLAMLVFIIPTLAYFHLFFDYNVVSSINVLGYVFVHNYSEDINFVYSLLRWAIPSILFFLIWISTSFRFKILFSFPLYMSLWRFFKVFTPRNYDIDDIVFQLVAMTILIMMLMLVLQKAYVKTLYQILNKKPKIKPKFLAISILLISIPFLHNIWKQFPEGTPSLNFFGFEILNYGFVDSNMALYVILNKICILTPLLVYFFIEKQWWKYSLLSPIVLYVNQLFNVFRSNAKTLDEIELTQSGPLLAALAVFLILLSKAVENQKRIKSYIDTVYSGIEEKVSRRFEIRQNYIEDKRAKLNHSLDELAELEKLKLELEQKLQE